MIGAYNARRDRGSISYPEGTLGRLIAWFTTRINFGVCLAQRATRQEYKRRLQYLEPEFDCPLDVITQSSLYDVRDRCIKVKWPAFADKMMTALSTMFTLAVQRGWMTANPVSASSELTSRARTRTASGGRKSGGPSWA